MPIKRLLLLTLMVLSTAACTTNYKLPESATSVANIRLDLQSYNYRAGDYAEMYHIDDEFICGRIPNKYPRLAKVSKVSIVNQINENGVYVETKPGFRVMVHRSRNDRGKIKSCSALFSFSPQKDRNYLILSSVFGDECKIKILDDLEADVEFTNFTSCGMALHWNAHAKKAF